MNQVRLGLRALGLCALVFGLMTLTASAVQAEAGAKWTVGGTDAGTLKAAVQATTLINGKGVLKSKIGGAEVKFKKIIEPPKLISLSLEGGGLITTGSQVKFEGISTELNGKSSEVCSPLQNPIFDFSLGEVLTNKLKGELYLHTAGSGWGRNVVRILPETGNVFAKLFFGEECSLPEEVPVITKSGGNGLVLKEPFGFSTESTGHEIVPGTLTELWLISETEEHKANLEGALIVALSGAHLTVQWKGTPG